MEYILFIVIVVVFIAIGAALYGRFYVKNEAREKYLERKKEKSRDVVYDYDSKSKTEEIEKTKKEGLRLIKEYGKLLLDFEENEIVVNKLVKSKPRGEFEKININGDKTPAYNELKKAIIKRELIKIKLEKALNKSKNWQIENPDLNNENDYRNVVNDILYNRQEQKNTIEIDKSKSKNSNNRTFKSDFRGTNIDNYAFDENWEENETLSLKVSQHFNNQFERKVWINNEYITTSLNDNRKQYDIDTSEYIISTYVQLTNSNEIMVAYPPTEKHKDDIVLEFLFLINLLSPNNDDNASKSVQNSSPQKLKDLMFSSDEMVMKFSCKKSSHICLSNRNDSYFISLYPPKSILNGIICTKEGEW